MAGVLSGFSFVIATTIQQLKNCCNNESTVKSTDFWLLVWKKWCFEKGIAKEIKITSRSSLTKIASLFNGRLHKILTIVLKSLFVSTYPGYLKELFVLRHSSYALRGKNVLTLPIPRTTNYGLEGIPDIKQQKCGIRSQTVWERWHHLKIVRQP